MVACRPTWVGLDLGVLVVLAVLVDLVDLEDSRRVDGSTTAVAHRQATSAGPTKARPGASGARRVARVVLVVLVVLVVHRT